MVFFTFPCLHTYVASKPPAMSVNSLIIFPTRHVISFSIESRRERKEPNAPPLSLRRNDVRKLKRSARYENVAVSLFFFFLLSFRLILPFLAVLAYTAYGGGGAVAAAAANFIARSMALGGNQWFKWPKKVATSILQNFMKGAKEIHSCFILLNTTHTCRNWYSANITKFSKICNEILIS